jgi:3-oxoacyl-[acyl-carrier-protein] synthase II
MTTESIVITGTGLVTSLGKTTEETWRNVLAMQPSIGAMPALETPAPDARGGYQAIDLPRDFAADLPREVRYLRWTIMQAIQSAGIDKTLACDPTRCGFVLGTTLHGMRGGGEFLRTGDFSKLQSFLAGNVLQAATAGLALRGDAITTCSACSSSLGSIALAVTLLETRQLDLVIAGGYDAVSEYAYGGFNALRLVADGPLRSFARDRRGMKLGEGYGIVVLERISDAQHRGAKPFAIIAGWGESADAHHLTQPDPQGRGAMAAINAAITRANISPRDVGLIAAHATGTPDNDAGEYAAFAAVFGEHLPSIPVTAFKTHLGHTLGGAGAVELILSACALRDQTVPACANVAADDVEFRGLSLAVAALRRRSITYTLNTSLGFGGANTCVVLAAPSAAADAAIPRIRAHVHRREVCVTGIGVVVPGAIGLDAFAKLLEGPNTIERDTGDIDEALYIHLLNARRVRRMSTYVKLSLAATTLACTDAGFNEQSPLPNDCSVLLGSTHGSASYCVDYYKQIIDGGFVAANPALFAEGVPNAAAAHLSLMLGLNGACQTVIGSRTAGLDALRLASLRIASGQWDRAIVGAAEEYLPLINEAYRNCGLYSGGGERGFATGSGAITFVLESRQSMEQRGGRCRGTIRSSASETFVERDAVRAIASVLHRVSKSTAVVGSANHTWIDQAEQLAIRKSHLRQQPGLYGRLPELFSVGPFAVAAAAMMKEDRAETIVVCTGYDGVTSAIALAGHGDLDPAESIIPFP